MKILKILLSLMIVCAFATSAMAVNVNISGAVNGIYQLGSMSIDNSGNVTLSVTGGGVCTPSSAVISPTTIVRSITPGGTAAGQTVSIADNCGTNLAYTASVTAGASWISVPASGTGSMAVTFNTTSLAVGSYSGTITVTPTGYAAQNVNVSLNISTTTPTPTGIDIGPRYPHLKECTIEANGVSNYFFTLDRDIGSWIVLYMSTSDWSTNQDMIVSNISQPKCEDIIGTNSRGTNGLWYNITTTNNEKVTMWLSAKAGSKFYVTVCNRSASTGKFALYWDAN